MGKIHVNKIRKAQIIVRALYNLDDYPAEDDSRVRKYARKGLPAINDLHELAVSVLQSQIVLEAPPSLD